MFSSLVAQGSFIADNCGLPQFLEVRSSKLIFLLSKKNPWIRITTLDGAKSLTYNRALMSKFYSVLQINLLIYLYISLVENSVAKVSIVNLLLEEVKIIADDLQNNCEHTPSLRWELDLE